MSLEEWFSLRYQLDQRWYSKLLEYKERLEIPSEVFEDILRIVRLSILHHLKNGQYKEILIIASIYSAYRVHKKVITFKDLIGDSNISVKSVLNTLLVIENKIFPKLNFEPYHYSYTDYLETFLPKFDISPESKEQARKLLSQINSSGVNFSGRDPKTIIAAIIYTSAKIQNEILIQEEICEVLKLNTSTLRKILHDIRKIL